VQTSTSSKQEVIDQIAAELPPDVAELAEKLGTLTRCAMQTGENEFFQAIDDLQLSFTQFKLLIKLWEHDSELSVKAAGDALGLSLPAISRAVDGLVQRGLVTRVEDETDRRAKRISATEEARELLGRLVQLRAKTFVDLATSLDPAERHALSDALTPVVTRALERTPTPHA
jgi:DNA-binding MarR family transcriptional regulator